MYDIEIINIIYCHKLYITLFMEVCIHNPYCWLNLLVNMDIGLKNHRFVRKRTICLK